MSGWMAWALALCAAQTLAVELPQQLAECGRLADAKLRLVAMTGWPPACPRWRGLCPRRNRHWPPRLAARSG